MARIMSFFDLMYNDLCDERDQILEEIRAIRNITENLERLLIRHGGNNLLEYWEVIS
jgi:hypothetical protein